MKALTLLVALMAGLMVGSHVCAQTAAPVPPPKLPVAEAPLEQHPGAIPADPPAVETPKAETPAVETPKIETPKIETPAVEPHPAEPLPSTGLPTETKAPDATKEVPLPPVETAAKQPATVDITGVAEEQKPETPAVAVPKVVSGNAGEVQLVEQVALAREAYRQSLEALKTYYSDTHNRAKLDRVEKELAEYSAIEKYEYLNEVGLASPALRPTASITAADDLYKEGMAFKSYPAFPDEKRGKLKLAVQKFRAIINDYPTSDKIDDAAFRLGEIYEGWYYNDFTQALVCFERCFQWNPKTEHPAYYKAAKLYDEKLLMRDKAVELYRKVISSDLDKGHVSEALNRLKELSAAPQ